MILLAKLPKDRDGPAVRREILNTLSREPGITKAQLSRRLNLSWSSVWHHVRRLESEGQLIRKSLFGRNSLYAANTPRLDMLLLPLLRDDASLRILNLLQATPDLRIQDVTRLAQVSRKQARRRLEHLLGAGLVERNQDYQAKFRISVEAIRIMQDAQPGRHWPR